MISKTSGLALEEIDTLFGKEKVATASEEMKATTIEEEQPAVQRIA